MNFQLLNSLPHNGQKQSHFAALLQNLKKIPNCIVLGNCFHGKLVVKGTRIVCSIVVKKVIFWSRFLLLLADQSLFTYIVDICGLLQALKFRQ